MDIQLIIKAPNQNVDDYVVYCNLDWTIELLKDHLSQSYPTKPEVGQQKLIYSGRFLHDHLHLKDILRHDENNQSSTHIFHLVCHGDSFTSHVQHSTSSQNWHNQSSSSQSSNETVNGQSSENTLRHRNVNATPPMNSFNPQLPTVLPPAAMPSFVPDSQAAAQIAAMQQMYAYYFSQYLQSVNPASAPGNNAFPNLVNFQQPPNAREAAASVPAPPPMPANQRNNVQNQLLMDENEEGIHRDWLEHAFLCCRFLILFFIVYFYSSPERLMIVIVGTIVVFLYHEGWFVRRNPVGLVFYGVPNEFDLPDEFENNDNEYPAANQDLDADMEVHSEHELEAAMDGEDPPHAQNPDVVNNNHIFSPLTFLQIFFSSLIPEPPPPVNIN